MVDILNAKDYSMLGDLLGETKGKIIGIRVLSAPGPKVEVTFRISGTVVGVEITDVGTYVSVPRTGGVFYGEGQGLMTAKNGEVATWTGSGIGKPTTDGGRTWRGAVYYETTSEKLARLNGVVALFEFDEDAGGATSSRIWEWK